MHSVQPSDVPALYFRWPLDDHRHQICETGDQKSALRGVSNAEDDQQDPDVVLCD